MQEKIFWEVAIALGTNFFISSSLREMSKTPACACVAPPPTRDAGNESEAWDEFGTFAVISSTKPSITNIALP